MFCRWFVILTQSSTSLQSSRVALTFTEVAPCWWLQAFLLSFFFFSSLSLKCSNWGCSHLDSPESMNPVTSRGDQVAAWVIQKNENGPVNMSVDEGFCFQSTVSSVRRASPIPNCQECLCCALTKTHYHQSTVFSNEILNIAVTVVSVACVCVCVNIRRSFLRCAEKVWRRSAKWEDTGMRFIFEAWTGEYGSSLACCYDVFVVLDLL